MGRVRSSVARHRLPILQRLLLDPRSLRRWVLVALAATVTAFMVAQVVVRAEHARTRWGTRQTVLVVADPVPAGQPVGPALRAEEWPIMLVPVGAFDRLDAVPDGATALGPLAAGTPLTDVAVTGAVDGATRPRVAVPSGLAVLPLSVGDTVEVWATVVSVDPGAGPTTRRVTEGATVVTTDDETVVLTVEAHDIEAVAEAAALATVTLVATS
ncbi:MAG: SAF domain-containing protein [Aquihabitans sp.]